MGYTHRYNLKIIVNRGITEGLFIIIPLWQLKKRKKNKRKFPPVPKTKGGVPLKYVRGAKNPKKREAEIKRTAKLYREGKLTPAMMKKIDEQRRKG